MSAALAPASSEAVDPHPIWLADRNAIRAIADQHSPMAQPLMDALLGFQRAIEVRIHHTPATTPLGVLTKAVATLQVIAEDSEPDDHEVATVLAEAQALFSIGYGDIRDAEWRGIVQRLVTASAAEVAFDAAHIDPFVPESLPVGPARTAAVASVPEEHWTASGALMEERHLAEDELLAWASPNPIHFAMKVLLCRGEGRDLDGRDDMLEREARAILAGAGVVLPSRTRA